MGAPPSFSRNGPADLNGLAGACRWHEQNADEIIASCDTSITEAVNALEQAGWAKESIKVVGECAVVIVM